MRDIFAKEFSTKASFPSMDLKQPILAIYTLQVDGKIGFFVLVVGSLGKLVFIAAEKCVHNSEAITFKDTELHVTTLSLSARIRKLVLFKSCLFYVSESCDLLVSEISSKELKNSSSKCLEASGPTILRHRIKDFSLLNDKGIFLLLTTEGNMYLAECREEVGAPDAPASLPSLMNEIMYQSSVLRDLSATARKQSSFFAALSMFASFKFNAAQKISVECSMTELLTSPKKFLIEIKVTSSETLDAEFWIVNASLHHHSDRDSVVVSCTVPFDKGKTFHMEVEESLLCSPLASALPLHLEVGLLLTLPDSYSCLDCFRLVARKLPLYTKVKSFVLGELYLLKNSPQIGGVKNKTAASGNNLLLHMHAHNMKKPLAHLLHVSSTPPPKFPSQFTFRLLSTTAENMVEGRRTDMSLADRVLHFIGLRSNLFTPSDLSHASCLGHDVAFRTSCKADSVVITIEGKSFPILLGLRIAVMELLLSENNKKKQNSKYINVPASVHRELENLHKNILATYGQDVQEEGFLERIFLMYSKLRELSAILPFC